MAKPRVGIYPGTFDPVTNGHIDIIGRATRVVDRLVIGVAANPGKEPLFSLSERCEILEEQVARLRNGDGTRIQIRSFDNLLMHFVVELGAAVIVRGLRAVSDFEFEFQMALTNRALVPEVEAVYLMPNAKYTYLSSSVIKDVARHGGDVSKFVPELVATRLAERFSRTS